MNHENTDGKSTDTDKTDVLINTTVSDYDTEGLAIKEEGLREGKIFPGLDADYPLRDPSEDPRWAVRTVKIWMWITIFCIVGILVLMILGIWYD
ncbi:MAG: hypothetical protein JXB48_05450 [Candidatus Latescibacteria bacterium]|nr:hypothetical protein [Candidatus Latescibacterota bacterium]